MRLLDVVYVERLKTPELIRWHSRRHFHDAGQWEVHAFFGGDAHFINGTERSVVEAGTLYLSPPGTWHAVRPAAHGKALTYYAVLFAPGDETVRPPDILSIAEELTNCHSQHRLPYRIGARGRLLFEELLARFSHVDRRARIAAEHRLEAFLWELVWKTEDAPSGSEEDAADQAGYTTHVRRALAIIESHRERDLSVSVLAREVGVSQEHLTRSFAHQVGQPPLAYHRRTRIEAAVSLLLNSRRPVKEIAWDLGFAGSTQFARTFRGVTGMSPTTFRSRYFATTPTDYAARTVSRALPPAPSRG
mgnify:FL=1